MIIIISVVALIVGIVVFRRAIWEICSSLQNERGSKLGSTILAISAIMAVVLIISSGTSIISDIATAIKSLL